MTVGPESNLVVQEVNNGRAYEVDDVDGRHFRECEFWGCAFQGGSDVLFERCKFQACSFDSVDLAGATFAVCTFDVCTFNGSNLIEVAFTECKMPDLQIINGSVFGCVFRSIDLQGASITGTDARYTSFDECSLEDAALDDSDLRYADLSSVIGLTEAQIGPARGNAATALPENVDYPAEWLDEDEDEAENEEGSRGSTIPPQIPAPLRLLWRQNKLVPDPRQASEDRTRDPAVYEIYRLLRRDVQDFQQASPTNHPISRHVEALQAVLEKGIVGLNAVSVGYHAEMIRVKLQDASEELGSITISQLRGLATGGAMLSSQFSSWRKIATSKEVADTKQSDLDEVAAAMRSIAVSVRAASHLFDRRIADSLELQADDVRSAAGNPAIQDSAARSNGNVASGLATQSRKIASHVSGKVGEEVLKREIDSFLEHNREHLGRLARWAPTVLGWLWHVLHSA